MLGLVVALLVLLNLGGLAGVLLTFGSGGLLAGLGQLATLLLLDLLGFWLLRQLRDEG